MRPWPLSTVSMLALASPTPLGLAADQVDIVLQLGLVALHEHHIIPTAFHHSLGDGAWREQGIHGDHPSLQEQPGHDVFQHGDLVRLVRDSLLPHGQPQAVTEHRQEMHSWRPLFATATEGVTIDGEGLQLACGWRDRREDTCRPGA